MLVYDASASSTRLITPSTGFTRATPITFVIPIEDISSIYDIEDVDISSIEYYFGDGTRETAVFSLGSPILSTSHIYSSPSTYGVSAVLHVVTYDTDGSIEDTAALVVTDSIKITNAIDETIEFGVIPPPTLPGYYTEFPYEVYYTTTQIDSPPSIDLYAQFTRSLPPQEPQNKWSFVRPEWRFTDINRNRIDKIVPTYKEIRIDALGNTVETGGTVIGLSGTAQFYFIEDMPSIDLYQDAKPTPIIWATLNTESIGFAKDSDVKGNLVDSYSTTKVRAFAPHVSYWRLPTHLSISENGARDFINPRWANSKIPFFVSVELSSTDTNLVPYNSTFAKYIPYSISAADLGLYDTASIANPVSIDIKAVDAVTLRPLTNAIFNSYNTTSYNGNYTINQYYEDKTHAAGYTRGTVVISSDKLDNIDYKKTFVLSATATVEFSGLKVSNQEASFSPYIWVPNPLKGSVSMVYYAGSTNPEFTRAIGEQIRTYKLVNAYVPTINEINLDSTDNYSGVYAVATSPGLGTDFTYYAWVADTETKDIYKINARGDVILTINLASATGIEEAVPAGICLDSKKNLWVTLYDAGKIAKFKPTGELITIIDPTTPVYGAGTFFLRGEEYPDVPGIFRAEATDTNRFDDVTLVEPTGIDTDLYDNVWVTYSNSVSSYIIKYDSDGKYIRHIYTENTTPQDIIVNKDNTIWVAETRQGTTGVGRIVHYNANGGTLHTIDNIKGLNNIAIDKDNNIWFTYDYNKVGKVNGNVASGTITYTAVTTVSSTTVGVTSSSPLTSANAQNQFSALEGIAVNDKGFVFVVHSIDNKVYVYNSLTSTTVSLIDTIDIPALGKSGIYGDANKDYKQSNQWTKSLQVLGDWTGLRWLLKYRQTYGNSFTLTGVSTPLNVSELIPVDIRKINQDFNMSSYLKDLVNVEDFKEKSPRFFDMFLSSVYGNSQNIDDFGTLIYERISNFLSNTADIDTCDIDSLYKLATMLNVDLQDLRIDIPYQLKQVINTLSISQRKLWGEKCKCNLNFSQFGNCTGTDICKICGKCKLNNKGEFIDIFRYNVRVGTPFVVQEKGYSEYYLHYPTKIDGLSTYSADMLYKVGFKSPVIDFYNFFEYVGSTNDNHIHNIIDWDNPYTTIDYNTISAKDLWSGDDGSMSSILNYYLYRGLKLL